MGGSGRLKDEQAQLLRLAVEEGYFEVPRGISLVELSDRVGMTDGEVSRKLRQALDHLLRDTDIFEDS